MGERRKKGRMTNRCVIHGSPTNFGTFSSFSGGSCLSTILARSFITNFIRKGYQAYVCTAKINAAARIYTPRITEKYSPSLQSPWTYPVRGETSLRDRRVAQDNTFQAPSRQKNGKILRGQGIVRLIPSMWNNIFIFFRILDTWKVLHDCVIP